MRSVSFGIVLMAFTFTLGRYSAFQPVSIPTTSFDKTTLRGLHGELRAPITEAKDIRENLAQTSSLEGRNATDEPRSVEAKPTATEEPPSRKASTGAHDQKRVATNEPKKPVDARQSKDRSAAYYIENQMQDKKCMFAANDYVRNTQWMWKKHKQPLLTSLVVTPPGHFCLRPRCRKHSRLLSCLLHNSRLARGKTEALHQTFELDVCVRRRNRRARTSPWSMAG